MFYVATLSRYVLVDAENETEARLVAMAPLKALHAELQQRIGRELPVDIRTVRPATTDEIDMMKWHNETLAREAEWQAARKRD